MRDTVQLSESAASVPFIAVSTTTSANNTTPIKSIRPIIVKRDASVKPPSYDSIFPPSPPLSASSASSSPAESFFSQCHSPTSISSSVYKYRTRLATPTKSHAAPALLSSPISSPASLSSVSPFDVAFNEAAFTAASSVVAPAPVLDQVFPAEAPVHAQPSEDVTVEGLAGSVVENATAATRTMYLVGATAALERELAVNLMDAAADEYACDSLVLALRKDTEGLGDLLHQLLYIGATVVSSFEETGVPKEDYILLGMEL